MKNFKETHFIEQYCDGSQSGILPIAIFRSFYPQNYLIAIFKICFKPNYSLKQNIMKKMPDELKHFDGPEDEEENEAAGTDGPTSPVTEEELAEA